MSKGKNSSKVLEKLKLEYVTEREHERTTCVPQRNKKPSTKFKVEEAVPVMREAAPCSDQPVTEEAAFQPIAQEAAPDPVSAAAADAVNPKSQAEEAAPGKLQEAAT